MYAAICHIVGRDLLIEKELRIGSFAQYVRVNAEDCNGGLEEPNRTGN
jgi:hypothetical protein